MKGGTSMPPIRKYLPAILIAAGAAALSVVILRMEKRKAADPHDHGHAEAGHAGAGDGHGDQGAHGARNEHGDHGGHGGNGHEDHRNRIRLDAEAIRNAGIVLDTVKPRTIRKSLPLNGLVQPDQDRLARMMPRFAGVVREVRAHLGDRVAKGQTLAIIESNESLAPYPLVSQVSGTVLRKDVTPGQVVSEQDVLYVVGDLGTVWIDLNVHREDFGRLRLGQEVAVQLDKGDAPTRSRIAYLSPVGAENTQTMLARLVLPNPEGEWRPGLYVDGRVTLSSEEVPLAVAEEAVQELDGREVIFVEEDGAFEAREVRLGARDGEWAELVSGAEPGDAYCAGNSYVLKAELGKGEAKHEH